MLKKYSWPKILLAIASVLILAFLIFEMLEVFRGVETLRPVIFKIFGLEIRFYGLILGIAALLGLGLVWRINQRSRFISPERLLDVALLLVLFGILGARLGFVIQQPSYYLARPVEIFAFRQGGLSIHGAFVLGIIFLLLYARYKKINFLGLIDLLMPGVVLGMAFGRFGNFFNQELYGYPTNLFWKMKILPENRLPGFENFEFFHPVFLYEMLFDLLVLSLALYLAKKFKHFFIKGQIFFLLLLGTSIGRFLIEFVRIGDKILLNRFTLAQIVTALFILIALGGFFILGRGRKNFSNAR